jgi:HK97 family phage major capsid protein
MTFSEKLRAAVGDSFNKLKAAERYREGILLDMQRVLEKPKIERRAYLSEAEGQEFSSHELALREVDFFIYETRAAEGNGFVPPALEGGSSLSSYSRSLSWVTPEGEEIRALRNNEDLETSVRHNLPDGIRGHELSLGRLLRGWVFGDWKGAEAEKRAGSIGDNTLGGFLVPSPLGTRIIDLSRKKARVLQAGAMTVPMESNSLTLAKVTADPTPNWKAENAQGTFSDATFGKLEFVAKTLVALIKVSVELFEDALNLETVVESSMSQALSLELDRAALYGSGAAAEPLGIVNTTGVGVHDMGTNGAVVTNYDPFSQAVEKILTANGPSEGLAAILAPRTWGVLDRLKEATTNAPLGAPASFESLRKLVTNQVPITRVQGSANNASDVFVGDFTQLLIGTRTQLVIEVSRQAGDSSGSAFRDMQIWLRAYLRADVGVALPGYFTKIIGIIP